MTSSIVSGESDNVEGIELLTENRRTGDCNPSKATFFVGKATEYRLDIFSFKKKKLRFFVGASNSTPVIKLQASVLPILVAHDFQ